MGKFSDGVGGSGLGLYSNGPPAKENYRTVGCGTGGVQVTAKRHFHWRDCDLQTTPSIPAKFETVLYKGNREAGGFGSQAPRFGQEARKGEAPGPGAHTPASGLSKDKLADQAIGQKGHGSFASRAPRMKALKGATGSQGPGPGFYGVPAGPLPDTQRPDARPHANFQPPANVNPAKWYARPSPGPGDYAGATGPADASKAEVDNRGAIFSARCDPTKPLRKKENPAPGPGSYSLERPRSASEQPSRPRAAPSQLKGGFTPRDGTVTETSLHRQAVGLLALEDSQSRRHGPGPGQYEPNPEVTSTAGNRVSFNTGESFRLGNSHLPRTWKPQCPGPCEYEAAPPKPSDHAAAAAFASKITRFKESVSEVPGPAWYKPRMPSSEQTDFHLNPQNLWT